MNPSELEALVDRAKNGDEKAFNAIVSAYRLYIFSRIRQKAKTEDLVEDCYQRVLMMMWSYMHTVYDCKNFGLWLNRLVSSSICNVVRQTQEYRCAKYGYSLVHIDGMRDSDGGYIDSDHILDVADTSPTPEQLLASKMAIEGIVLNMKEMNPLYAKLAFMKHIQDMNSSEIAKELSLTEEKARWTAMRATHSLRNRLLSNSKMN